jgi:bifunctional non-homologous end joining protein LigD
VLPKIDPIIPVLSRTVPIGREWLYEAKLDGFRGVLSIENGRGSFLSKSKRPMPRFKELADLLARSMRIDDAIFDGEIVVMTDTGPDFNALFAARGEPAYAAFDLLWLNGTDLRPLPFHKRKTKLRKVTRKGPIAYVEALRDPSLFDAAVRLDIEGIVAKRRADPYEEETQWVKVKHGDYTQSVGRAELFRWMRRRY